MTKRPHSLSSLLECGVVWRGSATEKDHEQPFIEQLKREGFPPGSINELGAVTAPIARGTGANGTAAYAIPPLLLLCSLARLCARRKLTVWIGTRMWPSPYSAAITHSLFIDPPSEALRLWTVEFALRSPAVGCVVAAAHTSLHRRFTLAAEKGGAVGLFVTNEKLLLLPSFSYSRWRVAHTPSPTLNPRFSLELVSIKGAAPLRNRWNVEIDEHIAHHHITPQTSHRQQGEQKYA